MQDVEHKSEPKAGRTARRNLCLGFAAMGLAALAACGQVSARRSGPATPNRAFFPDSQKPRILAYPGTYDHHQFLLAKAPQERCDLLTTYVEAFADSYLRPHDSHRAGVMVTLASCVQEASLGKDQELVYQLPFAVARGSAQIDFLLEVRFRREEGIEKSEALTSKVSLLERAGDGTLSLWQPTSDAKLFHVNLWHMEPTLSAWLSQQLRFVGKETCVRLGRLFEPTLRACINRGMVNKEFLASHKQVHLFRVQKDQIAAIHKFSADYLPRLAKPLEDHGQGAFAPLSQVAFQVVEGPTLGEEDASYEQWHYVVEQKLTRPPSAKEKPLHVRLHFTWLSSKEKQQIVVSTLAISLLTPASDSKPVVTALDLSKPDFIADDTPVLHPEVLNYLLTLQVWSTFDFRLQEQGEEDQQKASQNPCRDAQFYTKTLVGEFKNLAGKNHVKGFNSCERVFTDMAVAACEGVIWNNSDVSCSAYYSQWRHKSISDSDFSNSLMTGMTFHDVTFASGLFMGSEFVDCSFKGSVVFAKQASLRGAVFASDLTHVTFASGVDLQGVSFKKIFGDGKGDAATLVAVFGQAAQLSAAHFDLSNENEDVKTALATLLE